MPGPGCPDTAKYRQLAAGRLPTSERGPLLDHLEACEACASKLSTMAGQDALVELLRRGRPRGGADADAAIDRLVARLRKPQPSAAGQVVKPSPGASVQSRTGTPRRPAHTGGADGAAYGFLAPARAADEIGRLGGYRVLEVLGAGGMGVVFLAEDPRLKRKVALKAMLPALAASDSARERFLREAQAAAALEHDNIVAIFQVGEDRGVPFLAMPFLKGESLEDRLERDSALPLADVLRVGVETAKGLAAAHAAGLVHRDIKPANLWLENLPQSSSASAVSAPGYRIKVLDFGLARTTVGDPRLTQQGAIVGTPAYMAPEQAGGRVLDGRCDLFSLGCVLYRVSTGKPPFEGGDVLATLFAVATYNPPAPAELRRELPPAFSALVMRLLAKDPGDRPQSAQAVVEELEGLGQAETTQHPPDGSVRRNTDGRPGLRHVARRLWGRRTALIGLVVIAVLVTGGWRLRGLLGGVASRQGAEVRRDASVLAPKAEQSSPAMAPADTVGAPGPSLDAVRNELAKARGRLDEARAQAANAYLAAMDRGIESVRQDASLPGGKRDELVAALLGERQAFEETGGVSFAPRLRAATLAYLDELRRAEKEAAGHFDRAIQDCTTKLNDDEAAAEIARQQREVLAPRMVGMWECRGKTFRAHFTWWMYADGTLANDPKSTWLLEKDRLIVINRGRGMPPGGILDICTIAADGKSFEARNDRGGTYSATRVRRARTAGPNPQKDAPPAPRR